VRPRWQALVLLGLVGAGLQAHVYAATRNTIAIPSPGDGNDIQPALQAAVNTAANGDTLVLPEGEFKLGATVHITGKFLSFRGQGMRRTRLYRPESLPDSALANAPMLRFGASSNASSDIVVSDIGFRSKNPIANGGDFGNGSGGSVASDVGLSFAGVVDFTVTRCHFQFFGYAAIAVSHADTLARGLIYGNQFVRNFKGAVGTGPLIGLGLGYGVVVYGANASWPSNPDFGTNNFIFVEDNTFEYHRHSIAAGGNGRYVFRYNDVRHNRVGPYTHAIDAHEARLTAGANYYSTRAVEIYNNTVVNETFWNGTPIAPGHLGSELVERAIGIRGGEAVIHDNYIRGYRFGTGLSCTVVPAGQGYPVVSQIGYLSGLEYGAAHTGTDAAHADGDVFAWNNDFVPYASPASSMALYNYDPDELVEQRDYHAQPRPGYVPYTYPHPRRSLSPRPPTPKGDLDRDLSPDLILRHGDGLRHEAWLMDGARRWRALPIVPDAPGPSWRVRGVDDFDGDGQNDLVFWNEATGAVVFWLMDGVTRRGVPVALGGAPTLATNWDLAATGDFNADAKPDLVWRNRDSQRIVIWTMNGTTRTGTLSPSPDHAVDANWAIVAALDYNGDGWRDLLWYNVTTGKLVLWYLNGSAVRLNGQFVVPPAAGDNNWQVLASGDFGLGPNGSPATADILWRNATSGRYVVWYLDGAGQRTAGVFTTPDAATPALDWSVVGPR
jgi:hypothetical protein